MGMFAVGESAPSGADTLILALPHYMVVGSAGAVNGDWGGGMRGFPIDTGAAAGYYQDSNGK